MNTMNTPKNTLAPARHRAGRLGLIAAGAALALGLSGCAVTGSAVEPSPSASASAAATAAAAVTLTDGWMKAVDSGMTGAFGVLKNSGTEDIQLVSADSPVASMVELHETTANDAGVREMREKEGGFTIPAGGELLLEPGENHIMLMGLTGPLTAGEEVDVTLGFDDGSTLVLTIPVKDYDGANENYAPGEGGEHGEHAGADEHAGHGEHGHTDAGTEGGH